MGLALACLPRAQPSFCELATITQIQKFLFLIDSRDRVVTLGLYGVHPVGSDATRSLRRHPCTSWLSTCHHYVARLPKGFTP